MGVMSNIGPIDMKFDMEVEFDELNDYLKFGHDQLISCVVRLSLIHISEPTRPY